MRPRRADYAAFEKRWRNALDALQRAERRAHGRPDAQVPAGFRLILDDIRRVRAAFRETRGALNREAIRRLPWVRGERHRPIPRASSLACSFIKSTGGDCNEETLSAYLDSLQEQEALDVNEIWALKPFLQFVILEKIAAAAEAFSRGSSSNGLGLRPEAPPQDFEKLLLALQAIAHANWSNIFGAVSRTEKILAGDPSGIYPRMDPESRDTYRQEVVKLAAHSDLPETKIAAAAVELARQARKVPGEEPRMFDRRRHAGYYLIDDGRSQLEAFASYRPSLSQRIERRIVSWPEVVYVLAIEFVTVGLIAFLLSGLQVLLPIFAGIALLLLPAMESAVRIVNQVASFLIRPRRLPKLDFSGGIPPDSRAMVVVPNLLLSAQQVREAVAEMEVRYLANADPNLHFALLTDSPDSTQPFDEKDELVKLCSGLVEDLNRRYAAAGRGGFYLLHRHRVYNPAEGAWMGWERKRGKLLDLNNLLRGGFDSFPVKVGDLSILPTVRYVITLDSDTQLPRGVAQQLVGALVHPLNRAVIDPETNTVLKGYGILQPRVGISVHSVSRSRLASIFSGQTGFDLYTRAISDVYQDLFGEGSFTGKGVYEVDTFQKTLAQRFPANALLSHDLIEGSYARAGLLSDVEVIDDYPSHFSAYSRRKHRWVRGDWQILRWLLPHVPDNSGKSSPNPLSFISRWKILDNLRRSLIEAATLALLLGGWFFLPGGALYWTIATLVLLLVPSYFQLLLGIIGAASSENWKGALEEAGKGFITEQVSVLFNLVFLLHQALVTIDAIVRTLVRLAVTHRRMLEWETAAQSELKARKRTPVELWMGLTPWMSIALGAALVIFRPHALPVALPFVVAWFFSGAFCRWLDSPLPSVKSKISASGEALLRNTALRTWRFFREECTAGVHWLVPDTVQESPRLTANIISPTNMGLLLNARLAAYDLGFITIEEFARETEQTLAAMQRLPRHKGHFLNWTRTDTFEPVKPVFVSTVDSGNLAASLWTLKQGALGMIRSPLFQRSLAGGLRVHLSVLSESVSQAAPKAPRLQSDPASAALKELTQRLSTLGDDPTAWLSQLPELGKKAGELDTKIAHWHAADAGAEPRWWAGELRKTLQSFRSTAERLAPWTLAGCELQNHDATRQGVTLESLPQTLSRLETMIRETPAGPVGASQGAVAPEVDTERFLVAIRNSRRNAEALTASLRRIAESADALVREMDFRFLYNPVRRLLSIGYNVETQKLEKSCYDLLASEARTAAFIAIAKDDIREESWFQLGRTQALCQGKRALLSWSGTMFEYLMPDLWMKSYPGTILAESQAAAVRCQQDFGRRKRRPWGVSEAGYSARDAEGRYQYQAFGIPSLAISSKVSAGVVAPYATLLALSTDPAAAAENLRRMQQAGWLGALGFFESADYEHNGGAKKYELVRSWMSHHQGMILLALCNFLADGSMQSRFHAEPRVQATEIVLHERVPASVPILPADVPLSA
ncbi:MAG: glucoamylase family protein [Terriglobia bacterium]